MHPATPASGNIISRTLKLSLPMAGSRLIIMIQSFIGMLMIAQLGHATLAASSLISAAAIVVTISIMSILFSVSVTVGRAFGAQDHLTAGGILQQSCFLGLLISIPTMLILYFIPNIFVLLGQPKQLLTIVAAYFHPFIWSIPPFMCLICLQQFCQATLKQNMVIIISAVSLIAKTSLGYCLIFGVFFFPKLGVAGLAWTYVTINWVLVLVYLVIFAMGKSFKPYKLLSLRLRNNFHLLRKLFAIGWPISLHTSGELLSVFVTTLMIGWLGPVPLAVRQITTQYILLMIVPIFAIAQASGILVGHSIGSKQIHEAKQFGYSSIALGLGIALIALFIFIVFPKPLIALFVHPHTAHHAEIVYLAIILFVIYAISQCFDAVNDVATGSLRGLYDTKYPMYVSLACLWLISVPLAYIFGFTFNWGIIGIAIARGLGTIMLALIISFRWYNKSATLSAYRLKA